MTVAKTLCGVPVARDHVLGATDSPPGVVRWLPTGTRGVPGKSQAEEDIMRNLYPFLVVAVLFSDSAGAAVLWDNGIVPSGVNGRAISPPAFPDIRLAEDVTFGSAVRVSDFHANVIEDGGWTDGGDITLTIYEDSSNGPGGVAASVTGEFTKLDTGSYYHGRDDFNYWIEGLDIALGAGTYWFGMRNDNGGGAGTNYWMTSDGGPDGPGSSTGFFSLDGGDTWNDEGDRWHHAFVVTGIPEPSTCLLLGIGGLVLLRRR